MLRIPATLLIALFALSGIAVTQQRAVPIVADGHVHITNRVYWEGIDPWKPQPVGQWDYARARAAGINFVVESVAPYGYHTYNSTVKHAGRLIETFHRTMEAHKGDMELALSAADVRRIVNSGKMAVMLGIEAGFDQEGDLDILRLWYRLGVRAIQFSSQNTNAFSDSAVRGGEHWGGINDKGRKLIAEMNRLGMIIDVAHATEAAQRQIIAASRAPVIASHVAMRAVNAHPANMPDDILKAIVAKGGMVGIHSSADLVSARYYGWSKGKPSTPVNGIRREEILYAELPNERSRNQDYGDYLDAVDAELGGRWRKMYAVPWKEDPAGLEYVPSVEEYMDHIAHAAQVAGPESVALGLDLTNARSTLRDAKGAPFTAASYPDLFAALRRRNLATPGVMGENWLRVIEAIERAAQKK